MGLKNRFRRFGKSIRRALCCATVKPVECVRNCGEKKSSLDNIFKEKPELSPVLFHNMVRAPIDQGLIESEYAGTQCTSMAATALMMSHLKELSSWNSRDMSNWLSHGDKYHYILREKLVLAVGSDGRVGVEDLPDIFPFMIDNKYFIATRQSEVFGNLCSAPFQDLEEITANTEKPLEFPALGIYLSRALSENGPVYILLTIMGYSFAIKKENDKIYLLDSHSRDDRGQPAPSGEGTAILVAFDTPQDITTYLVDTYNCLTDGAQYSAVRLSFNETDEAAIKNLAGAIKKDFNTENINELQLS